MKYTYLLFLLFAFSCVSDNQRQIEPSLIPQPNKMELEKGVLKLNAKIALSINNDNLLPLAEEFKRDVADRVSIAIDNAEKAPIKLELTANEENEESYFLQTSKKEIVVRAGTEKGIFYGLQTLKQLLLFSESEKEKIKLPLLTIKDEPRFGWRGVMLDESRHFFGVESFPSTRQFACNVVEARQNRQTTGRCDQRLRRGFMPENPALF